MKSTILMTSAVLFLFSCGKSKNKIESEIPMHNFVKTFEGKINEEIPIIAKLECKDNNITGKYRYKNQLESLDLQGNFFNGDSLDLKEFNKAGSLTGTFKANYANSKISGTWSNAMGSKQLPFYLLESNTNYEADLTSSKQNIAGKYGRLSITNISENKIHAVLKMNFGENCAIDAIEGDFELIKGDTYKGQFLDYDDVATYLLKFKGNQVTLSQSPGEEYVLNGASCVVAGTYKK